MGIEFKIDAGAGIIYAVAIGNIGVKDIESYRKRFLSDPQYRSELNVIADYRMARINVTVDEAQQLAIWHKEKKPVNKVALVMGPDGYGFARMYQGWLAGSQDVEVFRDMISAMEWLGLPCEDDP